MDARKQELFGCAPISLEELGKELFLAEGPLSPGQRKALEEAAVFLRLSCSGGWVYEEEYQTLKTKLSCSPSVARLLGSQAAASQEEAEERARKRSARKPRSPEGAPRPAAKAPKPLGTRAGTAEEVLRRAGTLFQPKDRTLSALLDCFTPLVDESLFLSSEGQKLLNQDLAPLLVQRGQKLLVDESVVTELFRLFRGSVPYTDLELADLDPQQAQDLIAQRRELHSTSKNAIKVLRLLRQRKCLEVVFSPTDSPRPYENLRQVAEDHAGNRFLALTMDRQLAEERRKKLQYMTASSPDIPGLCWPQAMLFNREGQWAGYLMPKAEAAELCRTVYKPGRNNRNITALGWSRKSLALIAANMAGIFARMHAKGILMGDVNPRNFLVAPDCGVFFVDCDSYQFGEFPCPVRSDRYTPPEVLKEVRRSGRENYNYLRTPDHERYSMAVVLFEILMLGKSPYESRSTDSDNVLDAIAAGSFPYPFRTGEEGEEAYTNQAPVGRWREIWSHMTYQIKSGFHSTFTGKERLLREYVRQIELGHSSDDLTPEGFKDLDGSMLVKVCSECGKSYNIDEKTYARRSGREPDLCPTHRIMYQNFREREYEVPCSACGTPFKTLVSTWRDRTRRGLPMYCPKCASVQIPCSRCGELHTLSRERVDNLRAKNIRFLCSDCLDYERPLVTREGEGCQETFRTNREKLDQLRRTGRPVLCSKCLRNMLSARS